MGPWTGALAWPWWGRSLPKGNKGGLGLCHLPPQCPYTPTCPYTPASPYTPTGPNAPDTLTSAHPRLTLHSLLAPNAPLTSLASPQFPTDVPTISPDTPTPLPVGVLGPWTGAQCGWAPSPPATPNAPTPPTGPQNPYTPLAPNSHLMYLHPYWLRSMTPPNPLLAPEPLHSLLAPNAPPTHPASSWYP